MNHLVLINKRVLIILMILLFIHSRIDIQAQTRQEATDRSLTTSNSETYYQVMDLLMPQINTPTADIKTALTVRVEPSFESEFQYILLKKKDNTVEVIKKVAEKNIYYQIDRLEQTTEGKVVAADAAQQIKVKEIRTSVSAAKFDELANYLKFAIQQNETIPKKYGLDGTRYVFWLSEGKQTKAEIWGSNLKRSAQYDENPIIKWVRQMQKEVGF